MRLYNAAEQFVSFRTLVPPKEVLSSQRVRAKAVAGGAPKLGEAAALERTAAVVARILSTQPGYDEDTATQLSEHLSWTFNVYSGVAHGFAWSRLVPGTSSLSGHFLAELTIVANVTHLARDLAVRRSRAQLTDIAGLAIGPLDRINGRHIGLGLRNHPHPPVRH